MKDKIIKLLGGYTFDEYREKESKVRAYEELGETCIARRNMTGVVLQDLYYEKMAVEEHRELLNQAHLLEKNEYIDSILDEIINRQAEYIAKSASSMSELSFNRGTINGLQLLREEIQRLSDEYKRLNEAEEKNYDPYASF